MVCVAVTAVAAATAHGATARGGDDPSSTCRILVAGGGGSRGAIEAGIIANLIDQGNRYDLFTGISVGSLNTMFLASQAQGDLRNASTKLAQLWASLRNSDIYRWFPTSRSVLDSSPLEATIRRFLKGAKLQHNISIGAASLNTGLLHVFRERDLHDIEDVVSALMASTAIPMAFPPIYHKRTESWFVDGGILNNILLDFSRCQEWRKDKAVVMDVILCHPLLENVSSADVADYGMLKLLVRNYEILSNMLSNHPIYGPCGGAALSSAARQIDLKNIKIRLFTPRNSTNVSMLDFTHGKELWNQGYYNTTMKEYQYCDFNLSTSLVM